MQSTLVLIKPDGVKRKLVGEVISRFEKKGLKITAMKMLKMSTELAEEHYAEHVGKSFYNELISYITSGPVVAMVIEGREAVGVVRKLVGATDPVDAAPGTIRGDLSMDEPANTVHASDSVETAKREIKRFFPGYWNKKRVSIESLQRKIEKLEKENGLLKKRTEWYESQSQQMEGLIEQYNQLVKKEFDNIENVIEKMGTREVIDPITRVYSRDHMLNYINFFHAKAFQEDIQYSFIFVDVDDFEKATSGLNREQSDIILREMGKLLKETVRVPLDTVSRLGANEFLILLTEIPKKDAISVAKRINKTCAAKEFTVNGKTVQLTCTTSVIHFPEDETELSKLLENGEKLLEMGKKDGKNRVMFIK